MAAAVTAATAAVMTTTLVLRAVKRQRLRELLLPFPSQQAGKLTRFSTLNLAGTNQAPQPVVRWYFESA